MNEWPPLLCGPMLRRVTAEGAAVFLAAREPYRVRLQLFASGAPLGGVTAAAVDLLPLGPNLFVGVATAAAALAPGVLYEYDLELTDASGAVTDLGGLGLLDGEALAYAPGARPTFALAPGIPGLVLYHGSCRKPHGEGRDALAILDRTLAWTGDVPLRRPHQLVLTGDQIYADDVDLSLALALRDTAELLCGDDEEVPSAGRLHDDRVAPGPARGRTIETHAGYSTDDREGHLVFLAEHYAMYLMVYADALWPRRAAAPAVPSLKRYPAPSSALCRGNEVNGSLRRTLKLAHDLAAARRVFANVPTCMMFDDHEVTDDWNANREWRRRARSSPLGMRMMRNALIAYAVFQDWGNRPEAYAAGGSHRVILDAIRWQAAAPHTALEAAPALLDAALGLDRLEVVDGAPGTAAALRWDYHLDGAGYRIIALDTHTRRTYPVPPAGAGDPADLEKLPPVLLPPAELQRQLVDRAAPGRLPIVISGVPVVAQPGAETALYGLGAGPGDAPEFADREHWSGDRAAYKRLLEALTSLGDCALVLSGDVHYGFTFDLAYFDARRPAARARSRVVQLCSSALKNQGRNPLLAVITDLPVRAVAYLATETGAGGRARAVHDALRTAVAAFGAGDVALRAAAEANLHALRAAGALNREWPSLLGPLHAHLLALGPPAAEVLRLVEELGAEQRWTVRAVVDEHAAAASLQPGPLGFNTWAHPKIVGVGNIGRITFEGARVVHELERYDAIFERFPTTARDAAGFEFWDWGQLAPVGSSLPELTEGDRRTTTHEVSIAAPAVEEV